MTTDPFLSRRRFLRYAAMLSLTPGLERLLPGYARPAGEVPGAGPHLAADGEVDLRIAETPCGFGGRRGMATTINSSVPGPLLRLREGEDVVVQVANGLGADTSIHWHGVLVPFQMDGVPGVSFPGIKPGEAFRYRFRTRQSGTYWYHSHSGLQEQTGVYGPIIIDPLEPDPYPYDREYVVMLGDWTFENPDRVLDKLRKDAGYFNFARNTLFGGSPARQEPMSYRDRRAWARMRMDPTDLADVTGYTYTYLVNGLPPAGNWTGLFRPGERIRLRLINAGAGTYFDVRIPGLELTVVQADGQNIQPVTVEELRIAIAETYDVIVQPTEGRAYTIFAEAMDRSGYARGTLAPRAGMAAPIPGRRPRSVRTMADMGMAQDMAGMEEGAMEGKAAADTAGMQGQEMPGMEPGKEPAPPGAVPASTAHGPDRHGRGNSATPMATGSRLGEPGIGLGKDGWRVLRYADLKGLAPGSDQRAPEREIELHLTGNMERYLWSFDGKTYSQAKEPIPFTYGERLRLTFINDTMMEHPIHLHGMWMVLENGSGPDLAKKHTVNVKPAERLSVLVTADALGRWALHCHILYHMEMGMFRVVEVMERGRAEALP
jgi:CopA family copper-resistance protein